MKNQSTIVSVLATILAFLVVEYLFHFPSRMLHDGGKPVIDIVIPTQSTPDPTAEKGVFYCSREYDPVCGSDSITYPNACEAARSRVSVVSSGTCIGSKPEEEPLYEEISLESSGGNIPKVDTLTGTVESSSPPPLDLDEGNTERESVVLTGAQIYDTGSYQIYKNTSFEYEFALPKYAYYQGYGTRDGANHTLAISLSSTGASDFNTSDVRVFFFRGNPSAPPAGTRVDLADGTIVVDGDTTNPRVTNIINTIAASAKTGKDE